MELVDGRRLTGANLYDRRPGAIAEVRFADGEDPEQAIAAWRAALALGLAKLGWTAEIHVRRFGAGADLMFTADVDRLYAACDLAEWAIRGDAIAGLDAIAEAAKREQAARGGCLALIERAEAAGVPWLLDDDQLSLGHGARAQTWPVGQVPEPATLDLASFGGPVPTALITGTNGKTTCARLLARIVRLAGLHVGNTSTDGVYVDERMIEEGDWTGPGGARTLLRRADVEVAVLEVARGGMLRRGLGVPHATAALITNVSNDHLGEYGIDTLDDLARAKAIVTDVVTPSTGRIVLGADSASLVALARTREFSAPIIWVSADPRNPVLVEHRAAGGEVCTVIDGVVCFCTGDQVEPLLAVTEIPLTIAGRARHNVANVLGVVGLARGLGLPSPAILAGLAEFGSAVKDNPGRARVWAVPVPTGEVTVLLDFAHNQAGLATMAELVGGLERSVLISFGMAGDRSDEDLRALGTALLKFRPRLAFVREQPEYLRGRERGVVSRLLAEGLMRGGLSSTAMDFARNEPEALSLALAEARAGELIVHLVHTDHDGVAAWLSKVGARPGSLIPPAPVEEASEAD